jgi:hypothetical protein
MIAIRYRRRRGIRWRAGTLHSATQTGTDEMRVVLIDGRRAGTVTIVARRRQVEVWYHDRWVSLHDWAYSTRGLFERASQTRASGRRTNSERE